MELLAQSVPSLIPYFSIQALGLLGFLFSIIPLGTFQTTPFLFVCFLLVFWMSKIYYTTLRLKGSYTTVETVAIATGCALISVL